MKNEKLYNGITGIREDLITEAEAHKFRSPRRMAKRILTIAASLILVIGLSYAGLLIFIFGPANSGGTAYNDRKYMSYAGPIFPLTALDGGEGLDAVRSVNYDFAGFPYAQVTDTYTLTNTTNTDKTYRLAYPFVASFGSYKEYIPAFVGEESYESEIFVGKYTGGYLGVLGGEDEETGSANLDVISSWEEYKELLADGTYLADAFEDFPEITESVIVYEITNFITHEEGASPTLQLACEYDIAKTQVITWGTRGGSFNEIRGRYTYHYGAPDMGKSDEDGIRYLIILGEDIEGYTLQGFEDGGCDKGEEIEITATITRTERALRDVLYEIVIGDGFGDDESLMSGLSEEIYFGAFTEMMYTYGALSEDPKDRYGDSLTSIIADTRNVDRIMYLTFEVTIPAGESKTLSLSMQKRPSMDFTGKYTERKGFDMVTALGSSITFTEQTASVSNIEDLEIINQNFGFDFENGILSVTLNPETEHYYMDLRKKSEETE